jgi:Tat protein secretion system quality control protein TatD with DNase activity
MVLPFDAHNHVHMGPTLPLQALILPDSPCTMIPDKNGPCSADGDGDDDDDTTPAVMTTHDATAALQGMAIMSTHPRDFERVLRLSRELPLCCRFSNTHNVQVVPCLGVHPWFLHELSSDDWELVDEHDHHHPAADDSSQIQPQQPQQQPQHQQPQPKWLHEMEQLLIANPTSIVGEIGLDGFHFRPDTKELCSTMDSQVQAFEMQLELATRLQRPVSIHAVQCFGQLYEALARVKQKRIAMMNKQLLYHSCCQGDDDDTKKQKKKQKKKSLASLSLSLPLLLPPKIYFHAFAGKLGTVDQLLALCGRDIGKVYFGFASIVSKYNNASDRCCKGCPLSSLHY